MIIIVYSKVGFVLLLAWSESIMHCLWIYLVKNTIQCLGPLSFPLWDYLDDLLTRLGVFFISTILREWDWKFICWLILFAYFVEISEGEIKDWQRQDNLCVGIEISLLFNNLSNKSRIFLDLKDMPHQKFFWVTSRFLWYLCIRYSFTFPLFFLFTC